MFIWRYVVLSMAITLLSGCGGSSDDTGNTTVTPAPSPPSSPAPPVIDPYQQKLAAARLLNQATFGATLSEIEKVVEMGMEPWLDQQLALPSSEHFPLVEPFIDADDFWRQYRIEAWWQQSLYAQDQLRQRTAFALSEILVVSEFNGILSNSPEALAYYYDLLLEHAFGNYRDLIEAVTLSPAMGAYLSMLGNEKPDEERNIRPDENYARELMQLFTIGLVELNIDGSEKRDSNGQSIATYDQDVIKGFAHVYTGWNFSGTTQETWYRWWDNFNLLEPMTPVPFYHDTNEKVLFPSVVLSTNQTPEQDLKQALDALFAHDNVAPFISKQLIQKLVTSNPSPQYITRVAQVFNNNGAGIKGDLSSVLKAILLDEEARNGHLTHVNTFGKIREPLIKATHLWRAFSLTTRDDNINFSWPDALFGQAPLASPSVFNFYSPNYSPTALKNEHDLVAPELQIATESTITNTTNFFAWYGLWKAFSGDFAEVENKEEGNLYIDVSTEVEIAESSTQALVEHLNLVLTAGALSEEALTLLASAYDEQEHTEPTDKIANLIFIIMTSPQYAVQR